MIEMDRRMELRLNALITLKQAIAPGFCAGQSDCDKTCPMFKDSYEPCYWMKAINAINDLESGMCGYGYEIRHDTKPERSTKEQSRFDDIIV
jgi:hypothetical protein